MARIDLLDVCATLRSRERAGGGLLPPVVAMPDAAGARAAEFSIRDLSLSVFDGETMVVLGPSGCGKTTLLKLIAGLIRPDSGTVRYDGLDRRRCGRATGASAWSSRTTRSIPT
jgi:ABC-type transporter Mla maintaining outer membrane lipid asymmetry ATPase subunit MlaF